MIAGLPAVERHPQKAESNGLRDERASRSLRTFYCAASEFQNLARSSKSYTGGTAARESRRRRIWQKNRVWDADNSATSCLGRFLNPTHGGRVADLVDIFYHDFGSQIKRAGAKKSLRSLVSVAPAHVFCRSSALTRSDKIGPSGSPSSAKPMSGSVSDLLPSQCGAKKSKIKD